MKVTLAKKIARKVLPPLLYDIYFHFRKAPVMEGIKQDYKYYCPVCRNQITDFIRLPDFYIEQWDKYGYVYPFLYGETFNYLKYNCPVCGSSDRNRLYALYFERRFSEMDLSKPICNFLDIAPEKPLADWIKTHPFIQYRSLDLYMEGVDDKADITDLNIYEDNRFDIILCSHVLEHIIDDRKAMTELFRVLKPNGFAIIMVPILMTLQEDLENPEWTREADRWKYYGQNDHVRMYSKGGFIKKLEQTGFKVIQHGIDYFEEETFKKHGIHSRSVLYIVEK
jgi:predicted SAM-dependent methyltransferase